MTYPFRLTQTRLESWQLRFRGACEERIWNAAAQILADNPSALDLAARPNEFDQVLAEFVAEAPLSAIKVTRLPNCEKPLPNWRAHTMGRLIQTHLQKTQLSIAALQFTAMHHHLDAALCLRPRTVEHEVIIASTLTETAICIGTAEEALAVSNPKFETTDLPTPHPEDFRLSLGNGYHPAMLPSLLSHALTAGASPNLLQLGVRSIVMHTHWPTWRSLATLESDRRHFERLGRRVLETEFGLSPAARSFLERYCRGYSFEELPPQRRDDDVEF